jgi:two-component system sensor histidine kinase VanS
LAIKLKSKPIKRKDAYKNLKRKVFFQMFTIVFSAAATVIFLRYYIQKNFSVSDSVVRFLKTIFQLSNNEAITLSHLLFLNNMEAITLIAIFIFLVVILKFSLAWFTRYFDEVIAGMDQLVVESTESIKLSPELDFMENKLNRIKDNLDKQKKTAYEAEQRKNDLVMYLAHDIKTPLTSVIGHLSLLDEAHDMPPEQKAKYVGITLEKAYRLEQLINEFFEITRFNLQTIIVNKEAIHLQFMLQQIADEFYPLLTPQGKQVIIKVPDDLILRGDADKLARVFNNILKNAIAYSYENSVIVISAEQLKSTLKDTIESSNDSANEGTIEMKFTNQGNPIPPAKLETIFEKFYRLDAARSSNTGGAGLGLAIAQEIVTAHGGSVSVESNRENTTFTIKLPS